MVVILAECVLGLAIAAASVRDVFDTVVVPGHGRGLLKLSRRLVLVMLALWKRFSRNGIGIGFGPTALPMAFILWMLLLVFGFGLMARFVDVAAPVHDGAGRMAGVVAVHWSWPWLRERIGLFAKATPAPDA
jgi:hypothetical protein